MLLPERVLTGRVDLSSHVFVMSNKDSVGSHREPFARILFCYGSHTNLICVSFNEYAGQSLYRRNPSVIESLV